MTGTPERRQGVGAAARAAGVTVCGALPAFLTGGLAVQVRADLDFSAALLGIAIAVYFGVSSVSSPYLGHAAQRLGLDRSARLAATGSGMALLVAAVTPNYAGLAMAMVIAGLANALAQPAANGMLVRDVPVRWRALSFGIKQSAIPVATLVAGLAVPLIALTLGWRWAYAFAALGALVVALSGRSRASAIPSTPGAAPDGAARALEYAPLIVLGMSAALGTAAATSLGSFTTESAVDLGASEATAGLLLAMGSVLGIGMRLLSGWYSDRSIRDPLVVVALLLAGGSAGYAFMAGGMLQLYVAGVAFAFGLGWSWPAMFHFAVSRRYGASAAAATGVAQSGVYVGGVVGPVAFGLLAQHYSYSLGWAFAGGAAAIAALGIATGARMLTRRDRGETASAAHGAEP